MKATRIYNLEAKALQYKRDLITLLHSIQTGHPGGSLSCAEIITVLYHQEMNIHPGHPDWEERDRFVLSKGHAAPMLYLALADLGFFPKEELGTLRQINSRLQGHPCAEKTPGVDASTGSLGLGLGVALGMALAKKLKQQPGYVYVLLGDGEADEGSVWESAMAAAKYNPGNLIAILDHNGVQLDGTNDEIMPLGNIKDKFTAFGWHVITCDGHSISALSEAFLQAKECRDRPVLIEAISTKGKGVSFMEGKHEWHGKAIGDQEYAQAMSELGRG